MVHADEFQWYTTAEQASRINIWSSFNGWGQIAGGLIAYATAVGNMENGDSFAIEPWKAPFLWAGLFTILLGFLFLWRIPDSQLNARWLSSEDRGLAVARVRENQQGIGNKHFKLYQFKEALRDPMTWAFVLLSLVGDIPNGGISNFFSQMVSLCFSFTHWFSLCFLYFLTLIPTPPQISSFGFNERESLLYGVPGGAVEVIALLAGGYLNAKTGQRILCSLGALLACT